MVLNGCLVQTSKYTFCYLRFVCLMTSTADRQRLCDAAGANNCTITKSSTLLLKHYMWLCIGRQWTIVWKFLISSVWQPLTALICTQPHLQLQATGCPLTSANLFLYAGWTQFVAFYLFGSLCLGNWAMQGQIHRHFFVSSVKVRLLLSETLFSSCLLCLTFICVLSIDR